MGNHYRLCRYPGTTVKQECKGEGEMRWARIFKRLWSPGIDSKEWIRKSM